MEEIEKKVNEIIETYSNYIKINKNIAIINIDWGTVASNTVEYSELKIASESIQWFIHYSNYDIEIINNNPQNEDVMFNLKNIKNKNINIINSKLGTIQNISNLKIINSNINNIDIDKEFKEIIINDSNICNLNIEVETIRKNQLFLTDGIFNNSNVKLWLLNLLSIVFVCIWFFWFNFDLESIYLPFLPYFYLIAFFIYSYIYKKNNLKYIENEKISPSLMFFHFNFLIAIIVYVVIGLNVNVAILWFALLIIFLLLLYIIKFIFYLKINFINKIFEIVKVALFQIIYSVLLFVFLGKNINENSLLYKNNIFFLFPLSLMVLLLYYYLIKKIYVRNHGNFKLLNGSIDKLTLKTTKKNIGFSSLYSKSYYLITPKKINGCIINNSELFNFELLQVFKANNLYLSNNVWEKVTLDILENNILTKTENKDLKFIKNYNEDKDSAFYNDGTIKMYIRDLFFNVFYFFKTTLRYGEFSFKLPIISLFVLLSFGSFVIFNKEKMIIYDVEIVSGVIKNEFKDYCNEKNKCDVYVIENKEFLIPKIYGEYNSFLYSVGSLIPIETNQTKLFKPSGSFLDIIDFIYKLCGFFIWIMFFSKIKKYLGEK